MYLLFLLFTGFSIGITGAMIPGPLTLFTISGTLKTNKFAGFKTILGHIIIEFIILLAIFFGLKSVLSSHGFLFVISLIGGLALIAMGIILFASAGKIKLSQIKTNSKFNTGLITGGMVFSAISPGFIAWWATIGLSAVSKASSAGLIGITILFLGHWAADTLWYGALSYAVDKGKNLLNDNTYQFMLRGFSVVLLLLGVAFIVTNGY